MIYKSEDSMKQYIAEIMNGQLVRQNGKRWARGRVEFLNQERLDYIKRLGEDSCISYEEREILRYELREIEIELNAFNKELGLDEEIEQYY